MSDKQPEAGGSHCPGSYDDGSSSDGSSPTNYGFGGSNESLASTVSGASEVVAADFPQVPDQTTPVGVDHVPGPEQDQPAQPDSPNILPADDHDPPAAYPPSTSDNTSSSNDDTSPSDDTGGDTGG